MTHRAPPVPPLAVDALRRTVAGSTAYPADPAYGPLLVDHARTCTCAPAVVVVPSTEAAVGAAVDVARAHGLVVCGPAPHAEPSMLVLTHALDRVEVDAHARVATAGPGATWAAVTAAAALSGLVAVPSSDPTATVAEAVAAGTAEPHGARVVRADGYAHLVTSPASAPDDIGAWVVTALLLPLHPSARPAHLTERTTS
ncbi:FAD/FMN-containing dehydrogenase [Nocardioides cavernae]|uniref:FAD/FMN-containing dehydrogenase n=1 Tax=Nocardioides cavernae TaxID=1921566 RepID=A0A7Y9H2L2_9ACTN|nr:FAD-binding protein [Nocardioides cavernae]NYE36009.1 FAD/FMN-containing dehydrogenase [Nocardioides cavernae]